MGAGQGTASAFGDEDTGGTGVLTVLQSSWQEPETPPRPGCLHLRHPCPCEALSFPNSDFSLNLLLASS